MLSNGVSFRNETQLKMAQQGSLTSPEGCLTDRGLGASTSSGKFAGFLAQRCRFPPLAPHRLRITELQSFLDVA